MKDYYIINNGKLVAVWFIPLGISDKKIIPQGTKIIGKECFKDSSGFKKIYIPEGVEFIESGAFYNNSSLEEVYLPDSLKYVDDGAFAKCKQLKYMKFGSNTRFGYGCFSECPNLQWIENDGVRARTFYFNHANGFAITIEQPELCTENKKVYKGRFMKGYFPTEKFDMSIDPLFFVEGIDGKSFWYSDSLEECFTAVDYQASHLSFTDFFKTNIYKKGTITPIEFSFLTGVCFEGRKGWLGMVGGDDNTEFNLQDVLDNLEIKFPKLHKRLIYALDHQDEYNPILKIDDGIILSEFKELL